ncbi:MAG: PDZ domain-containing protein [Myxococcota bacterium]
MWWLAILAGTGCERAADTELAVDVQRDAERRMVHGTELALLWRSAQQALAEHRDDAAAAAVAMGLEVDRERFLPLVDALAETDDPQALAILASRVDRQRFRERAERSDVGRRYGRGALRDTLAGLDGVDRRRGVRVLEGVDAEYVVEPDRDRMAAAVGERFRQLADSADARAAFPRWSGAVAGDTVVARIDGAVAAGLPEPVAVGEGVAAALGALDPYTRPVWPAALLGWEEHHAGAHVGVGLELVDGPEGGVFVALPAVGGPGWTAGVHAGDRIVAVAGAPAAGLDSQRVAALLGGEEGSDVALDVLRAEAPLAFALTRASVREETVLGYRRMADGWDDWLAPGIGFVRIAAFRPHTDEDLDAWLPDPLPEVVVLDLRGNGGGDVMAAVNVADRFVAHGDLAHLEGRTLSPPQAGTSGEVPWNVAPAGPRCEDRRW